MARIGLRSQAVVVALACLVWTDAHAVEKGSQQVSAFIGSFGYSLLIEAPGFRGLEPRLVLSYNSEGRNGIFGTGWALSGFSQIERVNAGGGTTAFEGTDMLDLGCRLYLAVAMGP